MFLFPIKNSKKQKFFIITKDGCLMHQYIGLLFVKKFPNTLPDDLPSKRRTVEIFAAPGSLYVKLENHGKYISILPGKSLEDNRQWF
jgi:hypothetical protein